MSADFVIDSLLETVKDAISDLKSNEIENKKSTNVFTLLWVFG